LIEKGADLNAKDQAGNSPLKLAQKQKHATIALALERAGARDEPAVSTATAQAPRGARAIGSTDQ
jgi:hypothetical protein